MSDYNYSSIRMFSDKNVFIDTVFMISGFFLCLTLYLSANRHEIRQN